MFCENHFRALCTCTARVLRLGRRRGGASSGSQSKTTVKVTIPKNTSSDIAADITESDTSSFLYELSFTGAGGTYGPESATPGKTVEFENVTYGTYTFTLTIYADSDKKITVGVQEKTQTVSESENTVSFDLKYSDYENVFLASSFERFKQILSGLKADGTPYDSSFLTSGETTVYLTSDIEISQEADESGNNFLDFSTPIKTTIDLCGHTIKTATDTSIRFEAHNIDITFKNGNLNVYNITFADINDGNGTPSKITFDGIAAEQPEITTTDPAPSPLFNISCGGTLVLTGGSKVEGSINVDSGNLVLLGGTVGDDSSVTMNGNSSAATVALLGEWNGITATGANRIGSISATMGDKNYILFGGDSTAENVEANFAETDEESNLRLAQSAAISGEADVARLHLLDCAAVLTRFPFEGKRVLDVGSGAGFPGLVLKLLCPSLSLTLLDSTGKRVLFQQEVCSALELRDVACLHMRAEEAPESMREGYDVVVSRAVARLNLLAELCMPFVAVGGSFLAMKGPAADEELAESARAFSLLGGDIPVLSSYAVPDLDAARTLVRSDKLRPTPGRYPRRFAQMKKLPLA